MQIHASDPAFTDSERARANFRLAVKLALGFVVLIWSIQLMNWALDLGVEDFGVRPREMAGLPGIFFAPLMHSGFAPEIDVSFESFLEPGDLHFSGGGERESEDEQ